MVEEKKILLKDFLLKMKADDHVHNVKRKLSIKLLNEVGFSLLIERCLCVSFRHTSSVPV